MFPVNAFKKRITFDFLNSRGANPMLPFTAESGKDRGLSGYLSSLFGKRDGQKQGQTQEIMKALKTTGCTRVKKPGWGQRRRSGGQIPQNEILGFLRNRNFWRKSQRFFPVHHLLICLLRGLRTERWVACNKKGTLELLHPRTLNLTEMILLNTILCIFSGLECPSLHDMDRISQKASKAVFYFPQTPKPKVKFCSWYYGETADSWSWEKEDISKVADVGTTVTKDIMKAWNIINKFFHSKNILLWERCKQAE